MCHCSSPRYIVLSLEQERTVRKKKNKGVIVVLVYSQKLFHKNNKILIMMGPDNPMMISGQWLFSELISREL